MFSSRYSSENRLARKTISNLYNDKAAGVDFDMLERIVRRLDCVAGELLIILCEEIIVKILMKR